MATKKTAKKTTTQRKRTTKSKPTVEQLPVSNRPIDVFIRRMNLYAEGILKTLLSSHNIDANKFTAIVINEIKRNRKLLEAFITNPLSMYGAILKGAELGLIPNELTGEFWLIPRNIKQPNGQKLLTICPQVGYKGVVSILYRNKQIKFISTDIVYKDEVKDFEVKRGTEAMIKHVPNLSGDKSADSIEYAYAVIHYSDGEKQFEVMNRSQIEAIRDISPIKNDENLLYFNDTKDPMHWMVRKTVLLQVAKLARRDYYISKDLAEVMAIEGGSYYVEDEETQQPLLIDNMKVTMPNKFQMGQKINAALHDEN